MIINYYGLFIALGILAGYWVVEKINKKFSVLGSWFLVSEALPWVLLPAIAGARLYHVLDYWQYYSKNLVETFFIWKGGLGIFGGIFGGVIGLWIFVWKLPITDFKKTFSRKAKDDRELDSASLCDRQPSILKERLKSLLSWRSKFFKMIIWQFPLRQDLFLSLLDLGVIGLSIGQAIGRWGNYFNQELYGLPTNLPWGIYIRPENRLPGFEHFTHFHPLFLYESLGCWLIFFILMTVYRLPFTRKKVGTTFFLYLFLYSLLRFSLEFLRIGGWGWGILTIAQWISLGLAVISGRFFLKAFNQGI
jgi:phosphatidylglycerol:prolipoprotein diacylglycerol transferase